MRYRVTREGRDEVHVLFDVSDERAGGHSSVAAKVLLALSTPRVDPLAVVDVHRATLLRRVQATRRDVRANGVTRLDRLALEAEAPRFVEAELRWLDLCEAELTGGN